MNRKTTPKGFTLLEAVILIMVFSLMFIIMLRAFENSTRTLSTTKLKTVAVEIANAQMEVLRNIDYNELGTVSGSPAGAIPQTHQVTRSNMVFTVATTVRYYDDPYDGCAGEADGQPPDQWSQCADGTVVPKARDIPEYQNNPADYKKCDVSVSWQSTSGEQEIKTSTIVAPPDLEGETDKGFLLVKVIDADGAPVSGASVMVKNSTVDPAVDIAMTTNINGQLLLLDLEPAQNSYSVQTTKDGYTTDRTCSEQSDGTACTDSEGVPDPYLSDLSVHEGELEEATFVIDKYSALAVNSYDEQCAAIDGVDFTLQGLDKKISLAPEILKNVIDFTTDALVSPHWSASDVEWDLYDLIVNTAGYDIAGINHDLALNILPDTSTTINVLLAPHTAHSLLITIKDSGSGTNLSNASVRLINGGEGYDETKYTGQGFLEQADWSGGDGQSDFTDQTKYWSDDGHIDADSTESQITLQRNDFSLIFNEDFDTATYNDGGNTTADWNVSDTELKIGTDSGDYIVNERQYAQTLQLNSQYGKIVSATLSATAQDNGQTLEYYLSADGGENFEQVYLPMAEPHTFINVGDDLRVRIEMETDDEDTTPIVEDFSITYGIENFETAGELISSSFDLGEAAVGNSEFTTISWQPVSQPEETGEESVRFQLATNNDNSTWNFVGPDGTDGTYYTASNNDINGSHNGNRYVRYKVLLATDDIYHSPTLTDIRIGYTLECLPPGQTYFKDLSEDTYVAEVSLDGYQDANEVIDVSGYTTKEILLSPNP